MNIDYNNEAVAAFSAQCDEFIGSKLIMSNQKIRMLLRCMAYYDELKKLAYDCRFNFDYDDEYNRAIVNLGTATIFRLPASLRKRVALILCLLLDFDEGRRDFVKFVQDFYRADDKNDSYVGFINGIIAPFKEAVLTLLPTTKKPISNFATKNVSRSTPPCPNKPIITSKRKSRRLRTANSTLIQERNSCSYWTTSSPF